MLRWGGQTLSSLEAPQAARPGPALTAQPHSRAAGSFLLDPRGATAGALSSRGASVWPTLPLLTRGIRVARTPCLTRGVRVARIPLLTQGVRVAPTPCLTRGVRVARIPLLTRGVRVAHTPCLTRGVCVGSTLSPHTGCPCGPHSLFSSGASMWPTLPQSRAGASMWSVLPHPTWGHQNRLYFSFPAVRDQPHLQSQTFLKTLEASDEVTAGAD